MISGLKVICFSHRLSWKADINFAVCSSSSCEIGQYPAWHGWLPACCRPNNHHHDIDTPQEAFNDDNWIRIDTQAPLEENSHTSFSDHKHHHPTKLKTCFTSWTLWLTRYFTNFFYVLTTLLLLMMMISELATLKWKHKIEHNQRRWRITKPAKSTHD